MRCVRSIFVCVTLAQLPIALCAQQSLQPSTEVVVPAETPAFTIPVPPPPSPRTPFDIGDAIGQRYQVHLPTGKVNAVRILTIGGAWFRSTAADVGLRQGDLLFAIDGKTVTSAEELQQLFSQKKMYNGMVRFDLLRDGEVRQAIGPVATSDYGFWKTNAKAHWGGEYKTEAVEIQPDLLHKPVRRTVNALEITGVRPSTAAAEAGLKKTDVLITMNGYFMGKMAGNDVLLPPGTEGSRVHFVFLRDGKIEESDGKLTQVRIGIRKILAVGLSGRSVITELPNGELPLPLSDETT